MNALVNDRSFQDCFKFLYRLNKRSADGIVTAFFLLPKGFKLNLELIGKYADIKHITEQSEIGLEVQFKTPEVSEYFWINWKFKYKFEVK